MIAVESGNGSKYAVRFWENFGKILEMKISLLQSGSCNHVCIVPIQTKSTLIIAGKTPWLAIKHVKGHYNLKPDNGVCGMTLDITINQLRGLIGLQVLYKHCDCVIVEVLEDGPSLVLRADEATSLQQDQHGEAHRHVPLTMTIPVLSQDKTELSSALLSLDLIDDAD